MSAAIGDIAGSAYEFNPTKDYHNVQFFHPKSFFTDDTVCTFACAESLISGRDMVQTLRERCLQHPYSGYGGRFREWLHEEEPRPYKSYGNGSAMRCSAAGWLARTEEECVKLATETASPTHTHPKGIDGAVATSLCIFYLNNGRDKDYIRENVLKKYYPFYAARSYAAIKPDYEFDETCQGTVGAATLSFLESKDYLDCIKLAIALGGDADTLAAIAGPMAYAYYKCIPDVVMKEALGKLPAWMQQVDEAFDNYVLSRGV